MDDRILEGYLKDFSNEFDLDVLDHPAQFEHFINYCVMSSHAFEPFSLDDVRVGGDDDTSIDGLGIIVNDHLVTSEDEIEFYRKALGKIETKFLFVQSKTASKFDMGDIGNFLFGVRNFFQKEPTAKVNDQIDDLRQLKEKLYDLSIHMDRPPALLIYYASTGKWTSEPALEGRINSDIELLEKTNLFSDVSFIPMDADKVKETYRQLRNKVVKEIAFDRHIILPRIDGVTEAYIGILPAREYLRLLMDKEGNLERNLFYDNVRDFQGENPVNLEIRDTIKDKKHNDAIVVLNNGITIVAKSIGKIGPSFKISDFQIVNGCQTSHVLYLNRNAISENVFIPIKLIVTDNLEITNLIIKATNRQTEVKIEAFESLSPFHKKIEDFFATFDKDKDQRLYYERRSKQYDNQPIRKSHIISMATQTKCFLSMFLNEPHSTHRYYGELLKVYRSRLFVNHHSPFPYYISSYAFYLLEQFILSNSIPRFFRNYKYHMLTVLRVQICGHSIPSLSNKKIDDYCNKLADILWDKEKALDAFKKAEQAIDSTLLKQLVPKREAPRLRAFTMELLNAPGTQRIGGTIKYFNPQRGFGFIEIVGEPDLFVHITEVRTPDTKELLVNQTVSFEVVPGREGPKAHNVELIN